MTPDFRSLTTPAQAQHLASLPTPDATRLDREFAAAWTLEALLEGVTSKRQRNKISDKFWTDWEQAEAAALSPAPLTDDERGALETAKRENAERMLERIEGIRSVHAQREGEYSTLRVAGCDLAAAAYLNAQEWVNMGTQQDEPEFMTTLED